MKNPERQVDDELARWEQVRKMLGDGELDEQFILDTLEGETNLKECLVEIDRSILEDTANLMALTEMIKTLDGRKERIKNTIERKRTLILAAMEKAGIKNIPGPTGTLIVRDTKPQVIIDDEAEIPSPYWKKKDPVVDKAAILKALNSGEKVLGASLSDPGITLVIRRT